jgi:hypothetical protein
VPARVREPQVLAEQLPALCAQGEQTGSRFLRGAVDALPWLAEGGPGPLTGQVAEKPVMVREAARGTAVAEGKIYGRNRVEAGCAQGVLHALMWA